MEYRECVGCPGYCCMTNSTLSNPLTLDDIARMANYLHIPIDRFVQIFIRVTNGGYEDAPDAVAHFKQKGVCPFLRQGSCGINKVKPQACRDEKPMPVSSGLNTISCADWHRVRLGWI